MRTKALLCAAALAVSIGAAMAQSNVYSLNVVGYYNIPIAANQNYVIANQLNTTNNSLASLMATAPDGAQFQKFNGSWSASTYDALTPGWLPDGNATLNPGEGGFFRSPVATTITFVGEVLQGSLTNTLPINTYVIRSSMVPQAGLISKDLGLAAEDGDQIQTWTGTGWSASTYDALTPGWLPSEPNIPIGTAFFFHKASTSTSSTWVRNFTVQ